MKARLGDLVAITPQAVVGRVVSIHKSGKFEVRDISGGSHLWPDDEGLDIRVLKSREPEWLVDDVVLDATGGIYKRWSGDEWVEFGNLDRYPDDVPKRPLTLLSRGHAWVFGGAA